MILKRQNTRFLGRTNAAVAAAPPVSVPRRQAASAVPSRAAKADMSASSDLPAVGQWGEDQHAWIRAYLELAVKTVGKQFIGPGKAGYFYIVPFCRPPRARIRDTDQIIEGSALVAAAAAQSARAPFTCLHRGQGFDLGPGPGGCAGIVHPRRVRHHGRLPAAHLPDPNAWTGYAKSRPGSHGRRTSGWASASRIRVSSIASPTGKRRPRQRFGSFRANPSSDNSTNSRWVIVGGQSRLKARRMQPLWVDPIHRQ